MNDLLSILTPVLIMLTAAFNAYWAILKEKVPAASVAIYWLLVTIYWIVRVRASL